MNQRTLASLVIGAMFLIVSPYPASSSSNEQNIAKLNQSLLFVHATSQEPTGKTTVETGTGFIITESGYALTASHLVQSSNADIEVSIGSRYGTLLKAESIWAPNLGDAVLIQLPASLAPYKPVYFDDPSALQDGSTLVSAGFPLQGDRAAASGILSAKAGPSGLWQIAIPLNYGNSGSPVMDGSGGVVGMVKGGIAQAQEINFMIPLNLLSPLLTAAGLIWPPFQPISHQSTMATEQPTLKPPRRGERCHDETVVSAGLPPKYTIRTVCE